MQDQKAHQLITFLEGLVDTLHSRAVSNELVRRASASLESSVSSILCRLVGPIRTKLSSLVSLQRTGPQTSKAGYHLTLKSKMGTIIKVGSKVGVGDKGA